MYFSYMFYYVNGYGTKFYESIILPLLSSLLYETVCYKNCTEKGIMDENTIYLAWLSFESYAKRF
jgi:hypothetical protein